ncbi:MAG: hypothetical protein AAB263_10085 [Planctomycetota bacterium]
MAQGMGYSYNGTKYPAAPTATTAGAAADVLTVTTFDSGAANMFEFYAK